jgi:hypothetical protein
MVGQRERMPQVYNAPGAAGPEEAPEIGVDLVPRAARDQRAI